LLFLTNLDGEKDFGTPIEFRISDYDKSKTLVHVFEDFSFQFVLNE
jgi:hypothetical protein